MKHYIEVYHSSCGKHIGDHLDCEVCGATAVDIHHIKARGMGGNPHADTPENLIAVCRTCHEEYGDKKQHRVMLIEIVEKRLFRA